MTKKRKRWWIVGGVLGFVLLYSATAFWVSWNSPDARLEGALQRIIEENGFESEDDLVVMMGPYPFNWEVPSRYEGRSISIENQRRIIALLREACHDCTVQHEAFQVYDPEVLAESYYFINDDPWASERGSGIARITIVFDYKEFDDEGAQRATSLEIIRYKEPDPWSFLKNLWPW